MNCDLCGLHSPCDIVKNQILDRITPDSIGNQIFIYIYCYFVKTIPMNQRILSIDFVQDVFDFPCKNH